MRTGAQPAIMCKRLAYKTDVVTIIGAGLQGYTSLLCMTKLLDIKKVYVCDLSEQARLNFISKFLTVILLEEAFVYFCVVLFNTCKKLFSSILDTAF